MRTAIVLCVCVVGLVTVGAQGYALRPGQAFTVNFVHTGDGVEKGGWFRLSLDGKEHSHIGLEAVKGDGYVHMRVPGGLPAGVHTAKVDACNEVIVGTVKCRTSAAVKLCIRGELDPPCAPEWLTVTPALEELPAVKVTP